jgi:uncharacterized protein YdhG (YjbR/CyaY superfamily)
MPNLTMDAPQGKFATIDEYISALPEEVQGRLQTFRRTIQAAAPEAVEAIGYNIPAFKLNGKTLVQFGAGKNHIGFYPTPAGVEAFKKELAAYKSAKGSIQFPMDKPLPLPLIRKIVKFRVKEEKKKRKS